MAARANGRVAAQQLVDATILLLAGCFQRYCRDVYGEAVAFLVRGKATALREVLADGMCAGLQVNRGNPTPSALQMDFMRLGIKLWPSLTRHVPASETHRESLDRLLKWRNAIAHQSAKGVLRPRTVVAERRRTLGFVRDCRVSCSALAQGIDTVVALHLTALTGRKPW